jgi:hypothetical protein
VASNLDLSDNNISTVVYCCHLVVLLYLVYMETNDNQGKPCVVLYNLTLEVLTAVTTTESFWDW